MRSEADAQYFPLSTTLETKALVDDELQGDLSPYSNQLKGLGTVPITLIYLGSTLAIVVSLLHIALAVIKTRDTSLEALPRPDPFFGLTF